MVNGQHNGNEEYKEKKERRGMKSNNKIIPNKL